MLAACAALPAEEAACGCAVRLGRPSSETLWAATTPTARVRRARVQFRCEHAEKAKLGSAGRTHCFLWMNENATSEWSPTNRGNGLEREKKRKMRKDKEGAAGHPHQSSSTSSETR